MEGSQTFCPFPAPFPTLNVRKNFTERAERRWDGLPGEVLQPPALQGFKGCFGVELSAGLGSVRLKVWTGGSWRSPPTPTIRGLCELIPHPTPRQPRCEPQHAALRPHPSLGSPPRHPGADPSSVASSSPACG